MINNIPVIIPSYEPDENLILTCKNLINAGIKNIIVVNDGSAAEFNHYFEELKSNYTVTVLTHDINRGKGRALKTAFAFVIDNMPDALGAITADSDGQHSPEDIIRCMQKLKEKPNSLVLGCRDFSGNNVPLKSRFGNELTKKICGYLCDLKISDTQTGLRGIPLAFMEELLHVKGERFDFETYMLIESKGKFPIAEVKIQTIYDSKENHKTHFNPILDSIRIYKIFIKIFLKYIMSSVSSSLVDIFFFAVFCHIFKTSFPIIYAAISTILARIISSFCNYIINYKVVFNSKKSFRKSFLKYILLAVVQMAASAGLVTVGLFVLPFLPEVVIKMIVDTMLFFLSYFIQKRYVF